MRIVTSLIYHHTGISGENQAKGIINYHKEKWLTMVPRGMAYHKLIETNGRIVKGRPEWSIGYHAGNWDVNAVSVAIALSGDFTKEDPTDKQLKALARETIDICTRNRIRWEDVLHHWDVRKKPTACPGKDLKYLLTSTGKLDKALENKIFVMKKVLSRTSRLRMLRYFTLKRKISFLETQFK